ncbi:MAG: hypothetical protein IJY28_06350, partial [Clostridia bacterium]|nr:hypothetical protein [Clostridia bacterium]
EVFFEPGFDELQKVEKFMLGEEIPTEEDLTLYDLYGDGGVGLEDYAAYKAAVYGERSLLDAWVREDYPMKKSIATVTIDISTPQKAFRIQGVNMWGREIDEYWGANSLFSGADAHKNFNEMLRKSDPISNFDCLPNTIILGKHQIYWGQMRVKYAATTASGAIFYGDSTSIENGVFNYCSFTEPPTVHLTLRQGTTSVICLAATEVDTEGIKSIRIHRATSYTDTEGILVDYIAVGEAAQ